MKPTEHEDDDKQSQSAVLARLNILTSMGCLRVSKTLQMIAHHYQNLSEEYSPPAVAILKLTLGQILRTLAQLPPSWYQVSITKVADAVSQMPLPPHQQNHHHCNHWMLLYYH